MADRERENSENSESGHDPEWYHAMKDPDYYAPLEREPDERNYTPDESEESEETEEESYEEWLTRLATEEVDACYQQLDAIASQARTAQHYWELGGIDSAQSPLDALAKALARLLDETRVLLKHTHQWNEEGYCSLCGQEGRA